MASVQRIDGAKSNAHAGRAFELPAQNYFLQQEGLVLERDFSIEVGHPGRMKQHRFDLGSEDPAILIERKAHSWRVKGDTPGAKLTIWNEAMFYFHLAPAHYRKVLFVLDARHERQAQSLAEFYLRSSGHMVPPGVTIAEFNMESRSVRHIMVT